MLANHPLHLPAAKLYFGMNLWRPVLAAAGDRRHQATGGRTCRAVPAIVPALVSISPILAYLSQSTRLLTSCKRSILLLGLRLHSRLKILRASAYAGSIPAPGTNVPQ